MFKSCIKELRLDQKSYGLHSLRSGGITSVVHHNGDSISDTRKDYVVHIYIYI